MPRPRAAAGGPRRRRSARGRGCTGGRPLGTGGARAPPRPAAGSWPPPRPARRRGPRARPAAPAVPARAGGLAVVGEGGAVDGLRAAPPPRSGPPPRASRRCGRRRRRGEARRARGAAEALDPDPGVEREGVGGLLRQPNQTPSASSPDSSSKSSESSRAWAASSRGRPSSSRLTSHSDSGESGTRSSTSVATCQVPPSCWVTRPLALEAGHQITEQPRHGLGPLDQAGQHRLGRVGDRRSR
jgi:hypothetical protein